LRKCSFFARLSRVVNGKIRDWLWGGRKWNRGRGRGRNWNRGRVDMRSWCNVGGWYERSWFGCYSRSRFYCRCYSRCRFYCRCYSRCRLIAKCWFGVSYRTQCRVCVECTV
jgi:hypothetical protein